MESSENNLMFSLGGIPSGGNDVLFFLYLSSFKYRICFSDRVFSLGVSSSSYFQQLMFSITIHFLEASVFKRL